MSGAYILDNPYGINYTTSLREFYLYGPIEVFGPPRRFYEVLYTEAGVDTINDLIKYSKTELKSLIEYSHVITKAEHYLRRYGLKLREDEDDKLLYGYPEYIKGIVQGKNKSWELYLFIYMTLINLERMKYYRCTELYRDHAYIYGNYDPDNEFDRIYIIKDFDSYLAVSRNALGNYESYITGIGKVFNDDLKDGIGLSGKEGNAEKIIKASEDLMAIYRKVVRWRYWLKGKEVVDQYKPYVDKLINIADDFYSDMDKYYKKLLNARDTLIDIERGKIQAKGTEVDITLNTSREAVSIFSKSIEELAENKESYETANKLTDDNKKLIEQEVSKFIIKMAAEIQENTRKETIREIKGQIDSM